MKALVEPRSWDWNPTCDSETCKFNPLPVNCLLPRWRQPVMRSGSGLSGLERTGCLLSAWPRPFAAPLGSRSPGLRCHHLPPTSTCPFGPLCPAGTVASMSCGLQILPASTWVSSLHTGRSELLGTSCHAEGAGHATRWAPSVRLLPLSWTGSLCIHHFLLLPPPWVVQDGQISAGPMANERGRPQGGQGFKSPTKSPDCKQQPCRGQGERIPALPRERSVTGCLDFQPRDHRINTPGHSRHCSWPVSKAGYRTVCVEHVTAFIKSTLCRWREGSGIVAISGWQNYRRFKILFCLLFCKFSTVNINCVIFFPTIFFSRF